MKHSMLRWCWLIALSFVTACFSPQFKDGEIACGTSEECPPGLACFGGLCRTGNPGIDAPTGFPLTITLGGNTQGTVTSSPAGIDCGTNCSASFSPGTSVTLTATPMTNSIFVGWTGACSGTGTCTITVSSAVNITANFAVDNTLMVALAGNGNGFVSSSPSGIACGTACSQVFAPNTSVTLNAYPSTGSQFAGWNGGGCSGTGTCTVTTDTAKLVTATFTLIQNTLTIAKSGNGTGMVTSTPLGISCGAGCTQAIDYNTMVTLTATPDVGSTFTGWTGGGCTGTSTCSVSVIAATTVTAQFTLQQNTLTVTKSGNGNGTVTSAPAGINCGSSCAAPFDYGTSVTLSAVPSPGSTFAGWGGGICTGTQTCVVSVTAAMTVTASFTLNSYALTAAKNGNGTGTVTSDLSGINCGTDCANPYPYNTVVTLTAAPDVGSTFTGWTGGGCTGSTASTCAVTVTAATTVTATFTLVKYQLTVVDNTGTGTGTVTGIGINCGTGGTTCTEMLDYNSVVTLTATADPGQTFAGWTGTAGCTGTGTCVVTMTQAQSVTATFTQNQYLIGVTPAGNGAGTVTSVPTGITCGGTCSQNYGYGTQVTLTATPQTGSTFTGWNGGGCTGTGTCVINVSNAVTVTATFTLTTENLTVTTTGTGSGTVTPSPTGTSCGAGCSQYNYGTQVTLTAVAATGSIFTGWTDTNCSASGNGPCTVDMTVATTVTAKFTLGSNSLTVTKSGTGTGTVTSSPAGINCGPACSFPFTNGTTVILTATPDAGSTFAGWSGACSGTGTCSILIGAPVTATATFTLDTESLSVTKSGTGGGTVTSAPPGISCGATCSSSYNYNTSVTLTATPNGTSTFTGWTGGICSGTGTCVVSMTAAATVNAVFTKIQYNLTVKPQGTGTGTTTSSDGAITCGATCNSLYDATTSVTLTATPATGSVFVGWVGGGPCNGSSSTTCVVTMNADTIAYPQYNITQKNLTVSTSGASTGTVTSLPAGISCGATCGSAYDYGTQVTLTASPATGYSFTGWGGGICSGTGTCVVTMTADTAVTATFTINTYALTVNKAGNGSGTVTSTPSGISCGATCSETLNYGTTLTLTPAPSTGSNFVSWSGCTSVTGTTCNVTMNSVMNVTATFTLQTFTLTVAKAGTGQGTVTSSPPGINCGTGSGCAATFNYNQSVTLTEVTPVGSTFAGWSAAGCGAASTCTVTVTAAQTVTATFNLIPPNKIFVTSASYVPGSLNGVLGADTTCQNVANAQGLAGTYIAYVSSTSSNVTDRIGNASGWVRTDGRPFANSKSDLINGKVFSPPRITEKNTDIGAATIVTGTTVGGVFATGNTDCVGYTSTAGSVTTGLSAAGGSQFFIGGGGGCGSAYHLVCLGTDNQAAVVPVPAPSGARRAFMTAWSPGSGLSNADATCQAAATAASLTGTYLALLPTLTASALSRFDTSAAAGNWYRVDNMPILPSANAWTTATMFDSGPNLSANGATNYGNYAVWSGATAASLTAPGLATSTCNNWTDATTSMTGEYGTSNNTALNVFLENGPLGCNATWGQITCLQQ
jgi:hypothetical protein